MPESTGPSRRALLATSAALVGGLTGCLDGLTGTGNRQGSGSTTPSTSASPTATPAAAACTDAATPPAPESTRPFAAPEAVADTGSDCPARESPDFARLCDAVPDFPTCEDAEFPPQTVVCGPAAPANAPLRVVASTDRVTLPGAVGFTAVNDTSGIFATNFYDWKLWKRESGTWYTVAPASTVSPLHEMEPGERQQFCLRLSEESVAGVARVGIDSAEDRVEEGSVWSYRLRGLGGGEYAVGLFGDLREPQSDKHRDVGTIARFALDGSPIEVTQSGLVTDVRIDGDVVRGRWRHGGGDEATPSVAYVLRQVDDDRPALGRIAEQLVRHWEPRPLRDAVALARKHDAEEVRIAGAPDAFGPRAQPLYPIRYEERTYETRLRNL